MRATDFSIAEDISKASTPPSRFYTDPEALSESLEAAFVPSWQFIGDDSLVKVPGQVHPFTLLEGSLDEPLILTRDLADRIHLVSNVCTHRGNLVCEAGGNERFLRCRYHGRRFGLDGSFQSMPEFEGVDNFPSSADSLPKLALSQWGPLLFASLAPTVPAEDWFAPMRDRLGWMPLSDFKHDSTRAKDYLVNGHWALYVDNYLEGFHIPFIHAGLTATLDYANYATELYPFGSLQLGVAADGEEAFDLPADSPDYGRRIAAYYYWFFPNLMFNFYPWGLSINVVKPLAPDLTRVSFIQYVWDRSKLAAGAGAALDRVEREDEHVVELVQKGLRSRLYDRGRYSPTKETGTHHFHRMLASRLCPADSRSKATIL